MAAAKLSIVFAMSNRQLFSSDVHILYMCVSAVHPFFLTITLFVLMKNNFLILSSILYIKFFNFKLMLMVDVDGGPAIDFVSFVCLV